MASKVEKILALLKSCSVTEREAIFRYLRPEFRIHQIEADLNVQAEVICEAIHRASDLSIRGVRGLIAEASFEYYVVKNLAGWTDESTVGNLPYDFLLTDAVGSVRVQVKMQRQVNKNPMLAKQSWRNPGGLTYIVETQKSRTGKNESGNTRPYKYGEFDIVAVSLQPSTNEWSHFTFTVADWLLERPDNPAQINTLQPVSAAPDESWTDNFETCVSWWRLGIKKKIWAPPV